MLPGIILSLGPYSGLNCVYSGIHPRLTGVNLSGWVKFIWQSILLMLEESPGLNPGLY